MENTQGSFSQIGCLRKDTKAALFFWQEGDAKGLAVSSSSCLSEMVAAASALCYTKALYQEGASSLCMAMQSRRLMITFYKNSHRPGISIRKIQI